MRQNNTLIFASLFFLFALSSCGVRRYEVYTPSSVPNATRRLSTQYGIQVTPRDNYALYNTVAQWLGTPYRRGQSSMRGTDCSGFVLNVYRSVYGKNLARNSADMLRVNCRSIPRQNLREGDLVFFATNRVSKRVSHVGIYLKNGRFAHASTSKGVIVSSLDEAYYRQRWVAGGVVR
jgi:cell wall-associated NlpC family hydrolase